MKENILFTKYLAEEMSIPLTVLYNIIKQHKTTFKDHTSYGLLLKQINKLRNIHHNISKIENLDKKLETTQPEKNNFFQKNVLGSNPQLQ